MYCAQLYCVKMYSHDSTPFGPVPHPGACNEQPAALTVAAAGVVVLAGHLQESRSTVTAAAAAAAVEKVRQQSQRML
jgi:hypothetical protein